MKVTSILLGLKKYLPQIMYTVLAIIGFYLIYKLILRLRNAGFAIGGIAADQAENKVISKETGISTARVRELRTVAYNLSMEMETNKDQTWWYGAVHNIIWDSEILDICRNITSAQEIVVVKNFYNSIFTNNRNLYSDLQDELSQSNLNKVPYIEAIR